MAFLTIASPRLTSVFAMTRYLMYTIYGTLFDNQVIASPAQRDEAIPLMNCNAN
jgi:hypothetical protein